MNYDKMIGKLSEAKETVNNAMMEIIELRKEVERLRALNFRLNEARENANEACAKWEELYRAELEKKPGWVSVNDKMPEEEQDVLLRFESGNMAVGWLCDSDEDMTFWCCYMDDDYYTDCDSTPTHWMPLPEPPKEE